MKFFLRLKILLVLLFLIIGQQLTFGQYFSAGNDPSGIKWRQIKHQGISMIFPDYYEKEARELVLTSSHILPSVSNSLHLKPYPFGSVIHPESIISNGYTMWVPRKVELLTMPPLYPMAEKYTDHLMIHEYRHIVQLDKMDQGFTRVLGWFLGDQASASVQAIQVADWVSEGDAVLTETLLSRSGRGRSPLFSQGIKALLLDGCNYKFDKARFGSYKDFIPNHYVFGYNLVSMVRILDQDNFWSDMMDNVAKKPFRVSSYNRFLHKRTGFWQSGLFEHTKEYLCNYYRENKFELGVSQLSVIDDDLSEYRNYLKPYSETDSSWICLRNSYGDIPAIVRLKDSGEEDVLFRTGSINEDSYSYSEGQVCWAQQISDPRWDLRSYSDIFLYDIKLDKKKRLTKKKRFLYPVINSENTQIACIEEELDASSHLIIIDMDGNVVDKRSAPPGKSIRQAVWSEDNKTIYAIMSWRGGKQLAKWDLGSGELEILYDFAYKEINQLARINNILLFTAPIATNQGLYGYDLENGSIIQILAREGGVAYPTVQDDNLGISLFTTSGYRPARLELDQTEWLVVSEVEDLSEPFLEKIERTEREHPIIYDYEDTSGIVSTEYKKFDHLFNFHSWAPVFLDIDNTMIYPGAMIMSQNDLNSLETTVGVKHNKQHKGLDYFADFKYTGLYPEIGVSVNGGRRLADTLLLNRDTLSNVQYNDVASSASIEVPLFFSKGAYYQRVQSYLVLSHHRSFDGRSLDYPVGRNNSFDLSYATATLGLSGQVLRRMSYRDLFPRWGFIAGVQAQLGISNPEVQASQRYSTYIRLYFPGLFKNHSLRTYAGYVNQDKLGFSQLPLVSLPRGHYVPSNYNYTSFKVDYSFPIAYPDVAIPSILYLTRFKANIFTDGAYSSVIEDDWTVKTGIDLSSNFYFLRINAEFEAGIRIIYDPLKSKWDFEFLYSFDIN